MGALASAALSALGLDWRVAVPVVAALAIVIGAYATGHQDAATSCRAAELAGQLTESKAAVNRLQDASNDVADRSKKLEALNATLQAKVDSYERQIANPQPLPSGRPDDANRCAVSAAGARQLLDIAAGRSAAP